MNTPQPPKSNRVFFLALGLFLGACLSAKLPAWADSSPCSCPNFATATLAADTASPPAGESGDLIGGEDTASAPAGQTETTLPEASATATAPAEATGEQHGAATETLTPPQLLLNELLPDPIGKDEDGEFIELANYGEQSADLTGWLLQDGKGRTFALPTALVEPGAARQFPYAETKLTLTNSGGTIRLVSETGVLVDEVSYGAAPTGKSYARDAARRWGWNDRPTPGTANDESGFATTAAVPTNTSSSGASSAAPTTAVAVTDGGDNGGSGTVASSTTDSGTVSAASSELPVAASGTIIVSEVLPHPTGGNEWVELANANAEDMRLDGWRLDDAEGGSHPFALDGVTIGAGGYVLIYKEQSKIGFNDDGDAVRLINPAGQVASLAEYGAAPLDKSWANVGGQWQWTTPTPRAANVAAPVTAAPKTSVTEAAATPAQQNRPDAAVAQATTPKGTTATTVRGTVTLPPGAVGTSTFAVATGNTGIFVRAYGDSLPHLTAGTKISMTGKISSAKDGLTTMSIHAVDLTTEASGPLSYEERQIGALTPSDSGRASAVEGRIVSFGTKWMILSDGQLNQELTVQLLNSQLPKGHKEGETAKVRGVLRRLNGNWEMYSNAADVTFVTPVPEPAAEVVAVAPPSNRDRHPWSLPVAATPIGGAAATAYAFWRRRRASMLGGGVS